MPGLRLRGDYQQPGYNARRNRLVGERRHPRMRHLRAAEVRRARHGCGRSSRIKTAFADDLLSVPDSYPSGFCAGFINIIAIIIIMPSARIDAPMECRAAPCRLFSHDTSRTTQRGCSNQRPWPVHRSNCGCDEPGSMESRHLCFCVRQTDRGTEDHGTGPTRELSSTGQYAGPVPLLAAPDL